MSGDSSAASATVIMRLGTPSCCWVATASRNEATSARESSRKRYPTWWKSMSWPNRSRKVSKSRRLCSPSRTLTGSENWARTPPAALAVDPDPSAPASTSTTPVTPAAASS
jgi:hypothetical protein